MNISIRSKVDGQTLMSLSQCRLSMGKVGPLVVLGPVALMPNPKSGTVTMDVAKAVKEVKQGKIDFKVDKAGIIHTSIGKVTLHRNRFIRMQKNLLLL